jgi:hypothetical protein
VKPTDDERKARRKEQTVQEAIDRLRGDHEASKFDSANETLQLDSKDLEALYVLLRHAEQTPTIQELEAMATMPNGLRSPGLLIYHKLLDKCDPDLKEYLLRQVRTYMRPERQLYVDAAIRKHNNNSKDVYVYDNADWMPWVDMRFGSQVQAWVTITPEEAGDKSGESHSQSHSARVVLSFAVTDLHCLSHVGPDEIVFSNPVALPRGTRGVITVNVDGHKTERQVLLVEPASGSGKPIKIVDA